MKGGAFIKLPIEVLDSDAWRSLGINARRLIDFLMGEHMRHAGQRNGLLLAPRRQLETYGIAPRHVSAAIAETERAGLIVCIRGTGRRPSSYGLTWLPSRAVATTEGKSQAAAVATTEGIPQGYPKGSHKARSDYRRVVTKPENKGIRRVAPSKKASYHDGAVDSVLEGEGERVGSEETASGKPRPNGAATR